MKAVSGFEGANHDAVIAMTTGFVWRCGGRLTEREERRKSGGDDLMIIQKAAQVKIRMGRSDLVTAKWSVVVIENRDVVGRVNAGGLCAATNPFDMVPGWIWPGSAVGRNPQQKCTQMAAAVLLHQMLPL